MKGEGGMCLKCSYVYMCVREEIRKDRKRKEGRIEGRTEGRQGE